MKYQLFAGHVLDVLAGLEAGSVQACITSPPYWGLRSYQTDPQVWGGDADHAHLWNTMQHRGITGGDGTSSGLRKDGREETQRILSAKMTVARQVTGPMIETAFCACGAWRGELGSEPDSELFLAHLVDVFRAVRRVLRNDGLALINMGDSYSNAGQAGGDRRAGQANGGKAGYTPCDVPEKNLLLIPSRLARALQQDGWVIRSVFPWLKPNCMPESVDDRPTTGHEWWILATVGPRYYWDAEAIRPASIHAGRVVKATGAIAKNAASENNTYLGFTTHDTVVGAGRNYRTTDAYAASLAAVRAYHAAELARLDAALTTGLLLDGEGLPLGQTCNTSPYAGAHFATFSEDLIRPWIRAATSQAGQCAACGAPYRRITERDTPPESVFTHTDRAMVDDPLVRRGFTYGGGKARGSGQKHQNWLDAHPARTVGWAPGCTCDAGDPVPQRVLDPFVGTGTTVAVAVQEGREGWGIDVKEEYLDQHARPRLAAVDPLFVAPPAVAPQQAALFPAPGAGWGEGR